MVLVVVNELMCPLANLYLYIVVACIADFIDGVKSFSTKQFSATLKHTHFLFLL